MRSIRPYLISWLILNLPLALLAVLMGGGVRPKLLVLLSAVLSAVVLARWRLERQKLITAIAQDQPLTAGWLRLNEQAEVAIAGMRKLHQQKIAESLAAVAHWQSLLNEISQPVLLTDEMQKIVYANPAALTAFGDHVVGLLLGQAIRANNLLAAAEACFQDKNPRDLEASLVDGDALWIYRISLRLIALVKKAYQAAGASTSPNLLVFAEDITELRAQEQARVDFVANASHELRTPLASVLGFVETLQGPAREDVAARDRFLTIIHEEAGRMARLVNSLLSLSQVEQNSELPDELVDLVPLVREVAQSLEMQSKQRQMPIVLDLPDQLTVVGDDDQLAQVVRNLLDNALKYGRGGTPIVLKASQDASQDDRVWHIRVTDQGDGIPPESLSRLTERFYRVDKARARSVGGSGLGLAIVKKILQRHGGDLVIDSTLGQGSVFTIQLPVAAGTAVPIQPDQQDQDAA
jgi:two-component system phosphate regulon sensor histidine kinase PhoR